MRILYFAGAVVAPGSHGGATHVLEVASELSKLGHELHVVCRRAKGEPAHLTLPVEGGAPIHFYRLRRSQFASLTSYYWLARLATRLKPHLVMERYYNFAGAGMLYAHRHHLPSLLEVNAPMLDPPGSRKAQIDKLLLKRLEWWATRQAQWADRIVTPLHTTVPKTIPRPKIAELPWGANVDRFDPTLIVPAEQTALRQKLQLPDPASGAKIAVFAGSFRHWHGVNTLVEAAKLLLPANLQLYFLLVGGGPGEEEIRSAVQASSIGNRVILTGAVPHAQMPLYLSLANVGVAPFDTSQHAPLRTFGFYWSPLKIFEYMAMRLPVIVPDILPLNQIVAPGQQGELYQEGEVADLARAISHLLLQTMPTELETMGKLARQKVVAQFSWRAHAVALDRLIDEISHS